MQILTYLLSEQAFAAKFCHEALVIYMFEPLVKASAQSDDTDMLQECFSLTCLVGRCVAFSFPDFDVVTA